MPASATMKGYQRINNGEDWLLTVEITGPDGKTAQHLIQVPVAAIEDRKGLYGLATEREAVEAVIREHVVRLTGVPDPRDKAVSAEGTAATGWGAGRRDGPVDPELAKIRYGGQNPAVTVAGVPDDPDYPGGRPV